MCEKKLNESLNDSKNIFKRSNIDQYIDKPNVLFSGGKDSALDKFCYAECSLHYKIDNETNNSSEYSSKQMNHNIN